MSALTLPIEEMRTAALQAVAPFRDIQLVALFGSVALGHARPDSDVDVAILAGGFWDAMAVANAVAAVLKREAHVVDLGTASELLRYHVARDGILLFEYQPFAWSQFQATAALAYFDLAPIIAACTAGTHRRLIQETTRHG